MRSSSSVSIIRRNRRHRQHITPQVLTHSTGLLLRARIHSSRQPVVAVVVVVRIRIPTARRLAVLKAVRTVITQLVVVRNTEVATRSNKPATDTITSITVAVQGGARHRDPCRAVVVRATNYHVITGDSIIIA